MVSKISGQVINGSHDAVWQDECVQPISLNGQVFVILLDYVSGFYV